MSILYVMVGAPGSGKSTFIKNHAKEDHAIVSRDKIRFSMLNEDDKYFSKENEVFEEFIKQINNALKEGKTVWADATHLNKASRSKLLKNIKVKPDEINAIFINSEMSTCIDRNNNRKGTKFFVPLSAIERMYFSLQKPSLEENFNLIFTIYTDKPIEVLRRRE